MNTSSTTLPALGRPMTKLLRSVDGVETPGAGRWPILGNQLVDLSRHSFGRRTIQRGHSVDGALVVDGSGRVTFKLMAEVPRRGCDAAATVRYAGASVGLATGDGWELDGELTVDDIGRRQVAGLRYAGVYRRGSRALAVVELTISARPAQRLGEHLVLHAELNAAAPSDLLDIDGPEVAS